MHSCCALQLIKESLKKYELHAQFKIGPACAAIAILLSSSYCMIIWHKGLRQCTCSTYYSHYMYNTVSVRCSAMLCMAFVENNYGRIV